MQYSCRVISNHVGFDISTSAWLKIALMGCAESSLRNQLPTLEGTYCLHLYRSRVPKRMPGMSLYRSCMAFFSDLSTIEDASSFPTKRRKLMTQFQKSGNLRIN